MPKRNSKPVSGRAKTSAHNGNRSLQRIRLPYVAYVSYGKSTNVSFADLLRNDTLLSGVPWRLVSASFEAVVYSSTQTGQALTTFPPAFLQIQLNSASASNVEAVVSQRFMVTQQTPRKRVLRMRSPNVWKEDEQRSQALLTVTNLTFGPNPSTSVAVHIEATIQFGRFTLDNPTSLPSNLDSHVDRPMSSIASSLERLDLSDPHYDPGPTKP